MSTTADTSLLPWIGKDYSAGFRGKHILVLGESFYCDDCDPCILAPDSECRQMPRKTVDDYLSYRKGEGEYRSWMKTFIGCPRLFPAPERIPARPDYPVGRQALQQAPTARRARRRAGELRRFHPGSVGLSARRRPLLRGALPQPPLLWLLLGILAHLPRTIHKTLTIKAHTV